MDVGDPDRDDFDNDEAEKPERCGRETRSLGSIFEREDFRAVGLDARGYVLVSGDHLGSICKIKKEN